MTLTVKPVWLENNSYPVTCSATEGNPPNSYTWSLNGQSHVGSTWIIQARKEYHQSVLYCNVTNNYTVTKQDNSFYQYHVINVECKIAIIMVLKLFAYYSVQNCPLIWIFISFTDLPQVQPIPPQTVKEGNSVHLFCLARGNPEPTAGDYTWTDNQGNDHQTQNLTIGSVNKNHTGEYRCSVNINSKGGYGTLTGSTRTRITVQCMHLSIIHEYIHVLQVLD